MDFLNSFSLNFYSIANLANLLFTGSIAFGLYLIKEKSKQGQALFQLSIWMFAISLGYFVTQFLVVPVLFPRIFSLLTILYYVIFAHRYLVLFPESFSPKFSKWVIIIQTLSAFGISIGLIVKSLSVSMFYDYTGMLYDLPFGSIIKIYGLHLLFFLTFLLVTNLIHGFKAEKGKKAPIHLSTLAAFFFGYIPVIAYTLHKAGYFDRGVYITIFSTFSTIGFFILFITYLNYTLDKNSFLLKITTVAFSSFILVFNMAAYFISIEQEAFYDEKKVGQAELASLGKNQKEIQYKVELDLNTGKLIGTSENLELFPVKEELERAYFLRFLSELSDAQEFQIESFPLRGNELLTAFIHTLLENSKSSKKEDLLKTIQAYNRKSIAINQSILLLPKENFFEPLRKILEKEQPKYRPLVTYLLEELEKGKDLSFFRAAFVPVTSPLERSYRSGRDSHRYISYKAYNPNENKILEVGFDFLEYRKSLHASTKNLFWVLLTGFFLFIVGTPFFLSGAVVQPLRVLLRGVKEVREGDLDVSIPIKVYDEFGYLASSFNQMVQSIRESKKKLLDYAENLEAKVEERTRELSQTLQEVKVLKEQQDGDYFLTTLLLKPLGVNQVKNTYTKIDFFVKQKKEFSFKKQAHQIGGDICISHTIELRGKKYVVFLNADAMGKSIQGAGGILVLGAVFHSILQRTKAYAVYSESSPESWLKKAFKELHKVFETFDGSMLISLIFGLIEDKTGLVYYINAEHPWMILYRDGVADFLENDMYFRKLGYLITESEIFISTFQMQPGDMLIIGSDGKDDVVLSKIGDKREINENERLFLKNVEETKGDLNAMYRTISSRYELIDDLSLLSINYPSDAADQRIEKKIKEKEIISSAKNLIKNGANTEEVIAIFYNALEEIPDSTSIIKNLVKIYIKRKRFDEAAKVCRKYIWDNEADTEFLFLASYSMKMARSLEEAIDLGERVKLRRPSMIRNLLHLADLYTATSNFSKARKMLNKVYRLDPDNSKAELIQKKLEEKKTIL